jgi:hypothetical protein
VFPVQYEQNERTPNAMPPDDESQLPGGFVALSWQAISPWLRLQEQRFSYSTPDQPRFGSTSVSPIFTNPIFS